MDWGRGEGKGGTEIRNPLLEGYRYFPGQYIMELSVLIGRNYILIKIILASLRPSKLDPCCVQWFSSIGEYCFVFANLNFQKIGPKMLDHEGKEVPGNRGYK